MTRKSENTRSDIYARITDRIVTDLERGVRPWVKPWSAANLSERVSRPLRHNGQPYTGLNVLLLWSESVASGFRSSTWMTLRQANELGAHVRAGESGATVVYASRFTKTETDADGGKVKRDIPFLKAYTVLIAIRSMVSRITTIVALRRSRNRLSVSSTPIASSTIPVLSSDTAGTRPIIPLNRPHPATTTRTVPAHCFVHRNSCARDAALSRRPRPAEQGSQPLPQGPPGKGIRRNARGIGVGDAVRRSGHRVGAGASTGSCRLYPQLGGNPRL